VFRVYWTSTALCTNPQYRGHGAAPFPWWVVVANSSIHHLGCCSLGFSTDPGTPSVLDPGNRQDAEVLAKELFTDT